MRKKESACKMLKMYFWKHFKMKMSENDHTNSLDPDQDQQKRLVGPEGERSVRFKQCLGQNKNVTQQSKS